MGTGVDLDQKGVANPQLAIRSVMGLLLDGLGWRPLSVDSDYPEAAHALRRDLSRARGVARAPRGEKAMIRGLLLGLAVGPTCLASCVPAMVPVLIGTDQGRRISGLLTAKFLAGRLIGYLLFGLLAWAWGTT